MANSPSWIREIRSICNGDEARGVIDVFVFVECPTFTIAQGWYWKQCGTDEQLLPFLERELPGHLRWERRSPPSNGG